MDLMHQNILLQDYQTQKSQWPTTGKSIVAQYTDTSIILYQAFSPSIAIPAVLHQCFTIDNPNFIPSRMTWIKPNFLWMMYRSDWGHKKNQERTLAFKVSLGWFTSCILQAKLSGKDKNCRNSDVVVQWDPDHTPGGGKNSLRRDIQIGIRKRKAEEWAQGVNGPAIEEIVDITELVNRSNRERIETNNFLMPAERIWEFCAENIDLMN